MVLFQKCINVSKRPGLDFHTGTLIPDTGTGRDIPGFDLDPGYRDGTGF